MTDEEIAVLLLDGMSERAVASTADVTRGPVRRVKTSRGITTPRKPLPPHGTDARFQHGCPCTPCHEAHLTARREQYARGPKPSVGPFPPAKSAVLAVLHQEAQDRSRRDAHRYYDTWTESELSVALDYAHSATEAARMLGRTRCAVVHVRARHRKTDHG